MGRGDDELDAAAAPYVRVRITDMRDVDVNLLRFDFDLTFAVLLMHPDGEIYHRYGSRGPDDPEGYLSSSSLARLLRDTLPEHERYDRSPSRPAVREPRRAIDLPFLADKVKSGQRVDCVHCHMVNDAEYDEASKQPGWSRESVYVFPDPERAGFSLDPERQSLLTAVLAGSPAAEAGLRPGDELLAMNDRSVRTLADVQWILHGLPPGDARASVRVRRAGEERDARLELSAGWKRCPPRSYAWRAYKWNLSPAPGFGGRLLDADRRAELGVAPGRFAMEVGYLVNWGRRAHRGRAAARAGLRRGDVVVSFGGKDDFESFEHLHAWTGLRLRPGERTKIVVLRAGERVTLEYALPR